MANADGKDMEPRLLMVREVAGPLRVSVSSVYALVAQGRVPCHRIGAGRGSIRVSRTDLEALFERLPIGEGRGGPATSST